MTTNTQSPVLTALIESRGMVDCVTLLAPIALTADGLASLGFTPVAVDKNAKLYRVSDLGHICAALVAHIETVQARQAA